MPIIKTGLIASQRWSFCTLDGFCYMTNGYNRPLVFDGVITKNMSIRMNGTLATFSNNSVSGALAANGAYYYKYVYYNMTRDRDSNPSPISAQMTANASGANGIQITIPANAALESGVTHVKVYRTTNGGLIFYYDGIKAYTGSQITYDSSVADAALGEVMGELNDASTANVDINGIAPTCPYMVAHKGRIGMIGNKRYTAGTAAVTNANSTVTGTSTEWTEGMNGWYFLVEGDSEAYIISNLNTTAQTFTLTDTLGTTRNYQGSTNGTATYSIYAPSSIFYYSHKDLYGNPMPESFKGFAYLPINPNDNDDATGLGILNTHYFITKRKNCYLVSGDLPEDFRWRRLETDIGCCSHWTIANDRQGNAIWMDPSGVYSSDGDYVNCLSDDIENIFTGKDNPPFTIREGYHELSHGVFDTVRNRYLLWVVTDDYMDSGVDSTICDKLLVYDMNTVFTADGQKRIGWSYWDIPATCSAIIVNSNNVPEVWFGDEWGFVKKFDDTVFNDGVGSGADTRTGTATSADASSLTDSGASFYTTGSGLAGVFVHIIKGTGAGQIRRITTNTGTKLNITPNWSVSLDTTSVYAVGAIHAKRKTKIYDFGSLNDKIITMAKMVFDIESSNYSAYLKLYKNFSSTADSTKYFKLNDSKGYYEARYAANRAIHHQYEYGLHDVDKTMTIREIALEIDEVGKTEARRKQST